MSVRPVVAITGASAGVGRATAAAFARRGWAVGLIARGRSGLEEARREVEALGGEALVLPLDVANADAVSSAVDRIVGQWGKLDVWVNNAMVTVFAPADAVAPAEFKRVTEVTYLGAVHGTIAALAQMRRQGSGTIVQVGSALAYRSIPLQAPYCAAKAAMRAFTDSLRSELIHNGSPVRLTMVHLPAISTPQFDWARSRMPRRLQPVPPIHAPEVAAEAIVRAAHEGPRELWVGTPTAKAILGTMVAPGWLDRLLARQTWDGQMTDEPARARSDNLYEPVETQPDGRGRFADEAKTTALVATAATARAALAGTMIAAGIAALLVARGLARRSGRRASPT